MADEVHIYVYDGDNGEFLRKEPADTFTYRPRCKELAQEGYGVKVVEAYNGQIIYHLDPMPQ